MQVIAFLAPGTILGAVMALAAYLGHRKDVRQHGRY